MKKITLELSGEDYVKKLIKICKTYNMGNPEELIKVRHNETKSMLEFNIRSYFFKDKDYFKMRLLEKVDVSNLSFVDILKYTYQGHYIDSPRIDFIRFDFEPNTRKYAPLHINANETEWGDHLSFPDGTNLDIRKMDLEKALKVFELYSDNKNNCPLNQDTNQDYVGILRGEDKNDY